MGEQKLFVQIRQGQKYRIKGGRAKEQKDEGKLLVTDALGETLAVFDLASVEWWCAGEVES